MNKEYNKYFHAFRLKQAGLFRVLNQSEGCVFSYKSCSRKKGNSHRLGQYAEEPCLFYAKR